MNRLTRTVKLDVEVYVSKCEACGEEELTKTHEFRRETYRDALTGVIGEGRLVSSGWSFETHGEIRLTSNEPVNMVSSSDGRSLVSDDKSEWRLCRRHLALMRQRINQFVAEERARVS